MTTTTAAGLPDMKLSVRQTFGIDSDLEVPAYSKTEAHVPDLDPDYRFDHDTTIAILAGQSRPKQLRNHVRGAIANGVTKEEIREILLHATIYVGVPAGSDSWAQATEALKEINAY